jgi:chromosome segregation ATPase
MVVGANGTGKSTILNAICLGLGGEPKLLGRADDARGFIMHGKEKAMMEIELAPFEGKETHVLRREIDKNKGSENGRGRGASTFYINNERSNIKEVKELVTETYNISIDNLCTFLPQDKVGSFSGFDSRQLLVETEKTLSRSQHLYTTHQELIDAEAELADGIGNVESLQEELKKLQHENSQLEREKDRMEEREKALDQADLLQKKMYWLQFELLRARALECKEEKSQIKDLLKAADAELRPLTERVNKLADEKKKREDQYKMLDQNTQRCQKEMDKQNKKYETHDDEIENILAEIRELDSKRGKLQAEHEKAQGRVEVLEEQQQNFPASPEQVDKEFAEAIEKRKVILRAYEMTKRELRTCHEQLQELERKAQGFQQKLSQMNDDSARRRERIFRQDPNLSKIHNWLENNRGKFRHNIWGPIACEVSTKTQNTAAFLEQHVPNWILKAFVVESKEDYDLLYNEVRAKMKIPINIVIEKNGQMQPVQRMYSEQKMKILKKEHGILGFLDESFTAPDIIMQALRTHGAVHRVLVGGEETQISMDTKNLLDYLTEPDSSLGQNRAQGSCTFTSRGDKSFKFTQSISTYSGKPTTRIDDIFPARLLAPGVSERLKKEAEDNLRGVHENVAAFRPSLEAAEKKKHEMEAEAQSVDAKAKGAKNTKENYFKFKTKLANAKRKLKDTEKALEGDDKEEKKKLVKSLMNRVAHSITALEAHADQHKKMLKSTVSSAGIGVSKSSLVVAERQAK